MVYGPSGTSPEQIQAHVQAVAADLALSPEQVRSLTSEIRNALGPAVLALGDRDVSPEGIADMKGAIGRILALMTAIAR